MLTNNHYTASAVKLLIATPIMLSLMLSSQTFASEQEQSVANMVQEFINTAQWKQESQRSAFGDTVITSIKSLITNKTKQVTQNKSTLFASTQIIKSTDTIDEEIDGSVFFDDIKDHIYEQSIAILASHKLFRVQEKFYPHNYVRIAGLSKIVTNTYRIAAWLDSIEASAGEYVQTAYSEWFLNDIIDTVNDNTIVKLLTFEDMQIILNNIHKQYPKITNQIQVAQPSKEILTRWAMADYIVRMFDTPLNAVNYSNQRYASIHNSPYYNELRILIENEVLGKDAAVNPTATLTRARLIEQIVKTYSLTNKVLLNNTAYDIADIDGEDPIAPLLVFAYNQWWLEYILIQTKGQLFIEPNRTATLDEAYEILNSITDKSFITGIIDPDTTITQEKFAKLLVDGFGIDAQPSDIQPSTIVSPTENSVWLVQRVRNIIAKL